jgi:N-acetylneuraminic acid mutarotase
METEIKLTVAERHYQQVKEAKKRYYEKKKAENPVENRRPRGRPKKEHWVIETESEFLKNTGQVKVAEVNLV